MDGLVEQITACIARPTNQGSHSWRAGGGRDTPWDSHQRIADSDPTRGNRLNHGVDAGFPNAHHRKRSHAFGHAWVGHVDLAGSSRGGDAADLHLDALTRIRYPRDSVSAQIEQRLVACPISAQCCARLRPLTAIHGQTFSLHVRNRLAAAFGFSPSKLVMRVRFSSAAPHHRS